MMSQYAAIAKEKKNVQDVEAITHLGGVIASEIWLFCVNGKSDHFLIICTINTVTFTKEGIAVNNYCFQKAQWDKFREPCRKSVSNSEMTDNVDESTNEVTTIITEAEERRRQFCFSIGRQKETWDMYGI